MVNILTKPSRVEEVVVSNRAGIHARVSTALAKKAFEFTSEILYRKGRRCADGRSVIELLSLGAAKGDQLRIEVTGNDADEAMEALLDLFANRFYLDSEEG